MKKVLFLLCISAPLIAMDPEAQNYGSIQPPVLQMPNQHNQITAFQDLKNYVTSTPFAEGCCGGCCAGLICGAGGLLFLEAFTEGIYQLLKNSHQRSD